MIQDSAASRGYPKSRQIAFFPRKSIQMKIAPSAVHSHAPLPSGCHRQVMGKDYLKRLKSSTESTILIFSFGDSVCNPLLTRISPRYKYSIFIRCKLLNKIVPTIS